MPSLRKRVSSYFRQLSFYNEPREKKHNINENSFVTRYLEGLIAVKEGPPILYGKTPTDLPNYDLGAYTTGSQSIVGCFSGPNGGLTTVKRIEKHLSIPDTDIDFIDTQDEGEVSIIPSCHKSPPRLPNKQTVVDNTTMVIKVAGQEYLVTNRTKNEQKSCSLGSLSDFEIEIEKTKICTVVDHLENNNIESVKCKNQSSLNDDTNEQKNVKERQYVQKDGPKRSLRTTKATGVQGRVNEGSRRSSKSPEKVEGKNYAMSKSKSEGNPFHHKKKGKIIRITNRPTTHGNVEVSASSGGNEASRDPNLPAEWNRNSAHVYGISNSLYDTNQVTKHQNGDPIADCFGIIARKDSAILAVADGVNWGEKASIAAKSAVHGCLHYLDKTIFNDTKVFDELTSSTQKSAPALNHNCITNTREIFVCLLRAFNCAHDLILENDGMLTTLTVAVVLPLRSKNVKAGRPRDRADGTSMQESRTRRSLKTEETADSYICCVCNVGDTLAYVYSHKYGVRELTKGSHDVNCNRDMRDALGALGPVDGINPELSNLTLSITTVQKGDIIMVASDGLTDNFDPNVCKFTVNSKDARPKRPSTSREKAIQTVAPPEAPVNVPVKPPRKNRESSSRETSVDCENGENPTSQLSNAHEMNESSSEQKTIERKISTSSNASSELDNPLVAQFIRDNSLEEKKSERSGGSRPSHPRPTGQAKISGNHTKKHHVHKTTSGSIPLNNSRVVGTSKQPSFSRSKTSLEMRTSAKTILRNEDGIPFVTPLQRYEISLLLIEDVLRHGISGNDSPCTTAKKLCESLVSFTFSISAAKRRTLEEPDLYYDNVDGVLMEVSQQEKKLRRRRGLEKVQNLPGKLDHVSVVAYNVGDFAY